MNEREHMRVLACLERFEKMAARYHEQERLYAAHEDPDLWDCAHEERRIANAYTACADWLRQALSDRAPSEDSGEQSDQREDERGDHLRSDRRSREDKDR
jgi:hypothetical protein